MAATISRTNRTRNKNDAMICNAFRTAAKIIHDSSSAASRDVSTRVDEAEIPQWVYRRCASPDGESQTNGRHLNLPPHQPHSLEPTVSDLVHVALLKTGYPLHQIHCWNDDDRLVISGFVTRYFYAQIALETAMRLANGRRIEASIEILPAPDRDQWDE